MSQRVTVEVHRHGLTRSIPITPHVISVAWTRSIYQPWEAATIGLKTTCEDAADIIRPGDWVVARDETSKTIFWGHVADVGGGVSASGTRTFTDTLVATVESWLSFLHRTTVYVPNPITDSRGTLLSIVEWQAINVSVLVPVSEGKLGQALQSLHEQIARVDLPASLGGSTIGHAIPVVYDEDTALASAPGRSGQVDAMNVGRGNQTMLNFGFYQGSVAECYFGTFLPEQMLLELFPSLEDPGTNALTPLGEVLGAQPVLIYRIRPWRATRLSDAASTFVNFPPETDVVSFADAVQEVNQRQAIEGQITLDKAVAQAQSEFAQQSLPEAATPVMGPRALHAWQVASPVDRQLLALANIFTEVTWNVPRFGKRLNPQAIRSIKYKWSDANRTNVAAIIIGTDGKTGGEALPSSGLPITNDESILTHGARVVKPSITFNLESPLHGSFTDQFTFMRTYAAQIMQFQWGAHAMSSGEITLNPVDLRGGESLITAAGMNQSSIVDNRLRAGEILIAKAPGMRSAINCYIETINHSFRVGDGGAETLQCSIGFSRGLFEHQEAYIRNPTIPLKKVAPAVTAPNSAAAHVPAQTPNSVAGVTPLDAVAEAEVDWVANTTEADRSPSGRLAALFDESPDFRVKAKPTPVPWWCGIAVVGWMSRAGLNPGHVRSWYHVRDVEAFFTYGAHPNLTPSRIKTMVNGELISAAFAAAGKPRLWTDAATVRATPWRDLDFKRNDVMLINHQGLTSEANHIVLVRSYDKTTGLLETIEGNAHGLNPAGGRAGTAEDSAVCVNRRHMNIPAEMHRVYGVGRPSELDYDLDLNFQ